MLVVGRDKFSREEWRWRVVCSVEKFAEAVDVIAGAFDDDDLGGRALGGVCIAVGDGFDIEVKLGNFCFFVNFCERL